MSRRPARCTQADIARAIKAAQQAGLTVSRVEVDGGRVVVLTLAQTALETEKSAVQKWREWRLNSNRQGVRRLSTLRPIGA